MRNTLPAAYKAKFLTAGIGTSAPNANAVVSVIVLSSMEGPILARVLAILSSAGKYKGIEFASISSCVESNGDLVGDIAPVL